MSSKLVESDLGILEKCKPVAGLSSEVKDRLLDALVVVSVPAGRDIITEGSKGQDFFILLAGIVEVFKSEEGRQIKLVEMQQGSYFGEQALLGKSVGLRTATVRAKTDCRLASITAADFESLIIPSGTNKDLFEGDASTYLYREIRKSLDAFVANELNESAEGVQRVRYSSGETLIHEGEQSKTVFLVLSGIAGTYKQINGEVRKLSRMGSGQMFGELGVISGEDRQASVVAETDLEVLEITSAVFKIWYEKNPDVMSFFQSLSQVYSLPKGRNLSVFLGEVGGEASVTSVVGSTASGIVSTRLVSKGVVVFNNTAADALAGERSVLTFSDDKIKRELRVIIKEKNKGKISRCIVYAVLAEGIENDLGTLYQHILNLNEVDAVALRRFERTGFLGGSADKHERLCPCLGLGRAELNVAIAELGKDFQVLQDNIGVGSICAGCERSVKEFLEGEHSTDEDSRPKVANADLPRIADVPESFLSKDEKQLASLLARGFGRDLTAVSREQVAVRLRATGVRDMNFFIDILFPGIFSRYSHATFASLAAAVGRGIGFGQWRQIELAPKPLTQKLISRLVHGLYRLGRVGVLSLILLCAALSFFFAPQKSVYVWGILAAFVMVSYGLLSLTPSGRFLRTFILSGPSRFYRALWNAFDSEQDIATLRITPFGKRTYIVRNEKMVDYILQRPDIYARCAVVGYPPFASHSLLGGGSSGVWLGYRMLCEEYFAEGYRADLDEIAAITRERIKCWEGKKNIALLNEIYRIVIEIRARVLLGTSFDCFNDKAEHDYVRIVDRVLGPASLMFNDPCDGDSERLRKRCLEAVKTTQREGSVGAILRDALETGEINEREACENAVMYVLAQAPTMGSFWTLYRAALTQQQDKLRNSRTELVKAIKEELRLHAPVSTMFRREILVDDKLGDFSLKAGSNIIMCPMYIHTNARQWVDPYKYDASRWVSTVGDGGEVVEPKTDPTDSHSRPEPVDDTVETARYLPFGGGGQACQGRWFAADEMLVVIREILNHYELEIVDDQGLLAKPLSEQVMFHVYNRPYNDITVRVRRITDEI